MKLVDEIFERTYEAEIEGTEIPITKKEARFIFDTFLPPLLAHVFPAYTKARADQYAIDIKHVETNSIVVPPKPKPFFGKK